jgi:hypothetical protein
MIKTTSDMYILVREICVFIPATYLKRSEVLARIEQLRKLIVFMTWEKSLFTFAPAAYRFSDYFRQKAAKFTADHENFCERITFSASRVTPIKPSQTAYKNYIGINIVKKSQGSLPHKASYKQSFFIP